MPDSVPEPVTSRLKHLVAAGFLFVAGPAWAGESLVNGQPLQYNYEYHCNGERIVVGHCYDNDDNSYCQDYYPDRPLHNGFMVQPVEKRGDVIAKLNACAEAASAQTDSSGADKTVQLQSSHSPGLGRASWQLLYFDRRGAFYFTKSRLARNGNAAVGWFTQIFPQPQDYRDINVSNVQFMQRLVWADCAKSTTATREIAWYDANGRLIPQSLYLVSSPAFESAKPNTTAEDELNVLCNRPETLADAGPIAGDGGFLLADYLRRLNHSTSTPSGSRTETDAKTAVKSRSALRQNPPGLGNGTWYPLTQGDGVAEFFTAAGVKRTGKRPSGWFTDAYLESPSDLPGVIFVQALVEVDCANASTRVLQVDEYDKNKKRVTEEGSSQSFERAAPNTFAFDRVAFLCGKKPIKDYGPPVFGHGEDLIDWYQIVLEVQKQEAAQKQ